MRELLIEFAIVHHTTKLILDTNWDLDKARKVKVWLREHKEQLPSYDSPDYVQEALNLWRESKE